MKIKFNKKIFNEALRDLEKSFHGNVIETIKQHFLEENKLRDDGIFSGLLDLVIPKAEDIFNNFYLKIAFCYLNKFFSPIKLCLINPYDDNRVRDSNCTYYNDLNLAFLDSNCDSIEKLFNDKENWFEIVELPGEDFEDYSFEQIKDKEAFIMNKPTLMLIKQADDLVNVFKSIFELSTNEILEIRNSIECLYNKMMSFISYEKQLFDKINNPVPNSSKQKLTFESLLKNECSNCAYLDKEISIINNYLSTDHCNEHGIFKSLINTINVTLAMLDSFPNDFLVDYTFCLESFYKFIENELHYLLEENFSKLPLKNKNGKVFYAGDRKNTLGNMLQFFRLKDDEVSALFLKYFDSQLFMDVRKELKKYIKEDRNGFLHKDIQTNKKKFNKSLLLSVKLISQLVLLFSNNNLNLLYEKLLKIN